MCRPHKMFVRRSVSATPAREQYGPSPWVLSEIMLMLLINCQVVILSIVHMHTEVEERRRLLWRVCVCPPCVSSYAKVIVDVERAGYLDKHFQCWFKTWKMETKIISIYLPGLWHDGNQRVMKWNGRMCILIRMFILTVSARETTWWPLINLIKCNIFLPFGFFCPKWLQIECFSVPPVPE